MTLQITITSGNLNHDTELIGKMVDKYAYRLHMSKLQALPKTHSKLMFPKEINQNGTKHSNVDRKRGNSSFKFMIRKKSNKMI